MSDRSPRPADGSDPNGYSFRPEPGQILAPMSVTQRWQKVAELQATLPPTATA